MLKGWVDAEGNTRERVFDALTLGLDPVQLEFPWFLQERTYTSPIWYHPGGRIGIAPDARSARHFEQQDVVLGRVERSDLVRSSDSHDAQSAPARCPPPAAE